MEYGAMETKKRPLVINDSKFWKTVMPMQLDHVKNIEFHYSSNNCPLHPHLRDLIIDVHEAFGTTPLIIACQLGELDSVKRLVETWGVDVRASAKYYSDSPHDDSRRIVFEKATPLFEKATPLFVAAFHGHNQIVRYLLKKGADVSAKTSSYNSVHNGLTPLYGAVYEWYISPKSLLELQKERSDIVMILVEFGADPIADSFRPSEGQPMWMEEMCGVEATIELINHGLDLEKRNRRTGETLLHHWASCPHEFITEEDSLAIVSLLVVKGADLLARDDEGLTPLQKAENNLSLKILDFLLERDEYGRTEKVNAMELAGAKILYDAKNNASYFPKAFEYWRRAQQLRQMEIEVSGPSAKKILGRKIGKHLEWTSSADLDQLI